MFIAQRFAFLYNLYIDIARFFMSNFARVFLNAKDAGKFAVANKAVYALSSEDNGHQN